MNSSSSTIVEFAGWMSQNALNLLIQSSALILIGLLIAQLLRRRGSAIQSAVYRATLVAVLLCPITAVLLDRLGYDGWTLKLPEVTQISMLAQMSDSGSTSPLVSSDKSDIAGQSELDMANLSVPSSPLLPSDEPERVSGVGTELAHKKAKVSADDFDTAQISLVLSRSDNRMTSRTVWVVLYLSCAATWLIGTLVLLSRLAFAYRRLGRIRKQSSLASESERSVCCQLAAKIRVKAPDVRYTSLLSSPCLTGIAVPTILLPSEVKNPALVEQSLVHELAHLRRYDIVWNLIQRLSLSLLFFQPLMWWLVSRLEATAEEVCDDFVVRHCQDRAGYAQQLVELMESNLLPPNLAGLGMFRSGRSLLGRRVVRILDTTRKLTTQNSLPVVLSVAALTLVCTTLVGFLGNASSAKSKNLADQYVSERDFVSDKARTVGNSLTIDSQGKRAQLSDPSQLGSANQQEPAQQSELISIQGQVVDKDNNPIADAKITLRYRFFTGPMPKPLEQTTTDAQGRFRVKYRVDSMKQFPMLRPDKFNATIEVTKTGFARNWIDVRQIRDSKKALIKMSDEVSDMVINLIDTEGNPIQGKAVAYIHEITRYKQPLHEIAKKGGNIEKNLRQAVPENGRLYTRFHIAVEANKKGQIRLNQLGKNRTYRVQLNGSKIANHYLTFATGTDRNIRYTNRSGDQVVLYANDSSVVCEPGQTVTGIIRDSETKKPLANVQLIGSSSPALKFSITSIFKAKTDKHGRYTMDGLGIGEGNAFFAVPEKGEPYLARYFRVPPTEHGKPVQFDVELHRGVPIKVHVTDKATGRPIPGASLVYAPLASNPTNDKFPEYRIFYVFPGCPGEVRMTDKKGNCVLVGMKGQAIIGLRLNGRDIRMGQGAKAITKVMGEGFFRTPMTLDGLVTRRHRVGLESLAALQLVDIKDHDSVVKCHFEIDMAPVRKPGGGSKK